MKRSILTVLFIVFFAGVVSAQYAGQLSSAGTVFKGKSKAGGYAGIYEGAFGVVGQYRYGVGGYSDVGLKAAVIDLKSNSNKGDMGFSVSADYKYQIMEVRIMDPIDLSLGGALELVKFNHFSNVMLGAVAIGSYPVAMNNGRNLIPYGRLVLGVDRSKVSGFDAKSEFNLSLNLGTTYELASGTIALAEFQIDSDVASFMLGLTFGL